MPLHSFAILEGNDRVLVGPGSGRLVIATTARALTWQWRLRLWSEAMLSNEDELTWTVGKIMAPVNSTQADLMAFEACAPAAPPYRGRKGRLGARVPSRRLNECPGFSFWPHFGQVDWF